MSEQRIVRVPKGESIPSEWKFIQWLGTESAGLYTPDSYKAGYDVILAEYIGDTDDLIGCE